MKSFFGSLMLTSVTSSAMATAVAAPGPEIGDGVVGIAVATVAVLALVMLPRFKRMRQSKQ
jgi:hypothetical protein